MVLYLLTLFQIVDCALGADGHCAEAGIGRKRRERVREDLGQGLCLCCWLGRSGISRLRGREIGFNRGGGDGLVCSGVVLVI